jgi:hypothetical protein
MKRAAHASMGAGVGSEASAGKSAKRRKVQEPETTASERQDAKVGSSIKALDTNSKDKKKRKRDGKDSVQTNGEQDTPSTPAAENDGKVQRKKRRKQRKEDSDALEPTHPDKKKEEDGADEAGSQDAASGPKARFIVFIGIPIPR